MIQSVSISPDFITSEQEAAILAEIAKIMPKPSKSPYRNAIRRYGAFTYPDNIVSPDLPEWALQFTEAITFDHVTVNEYYPGQQINWHVDSKESGEEITVLSLLSGAKIQFKRYHELQTFYLPPRSLACFWGDARWNWEHYLKAEEKRYSVVFRQSK